jgi:perosamine synthetase
MRKIIPLVKTNIPSRKSLLPQLTKVLYSGYIAEGEEVKIFEKRFSRYIGNPFVLSFNSGTSALHAALLLAGVKRGDEVISTPLTAEPTNMAILHTGAKIIWGDVDYCTGNLSAESVRAKITARTKAIVAVHYAGAPADLKSFQKLSSDFGVPLVEDAAHALGARFGGVMIGNHSPFVMFSFQAIKHLTTGDGGMLAVQDETKHREGRLLRWFGIDKTVPRLENDVKSIGYKYHMNNVAAAIGNVQMGSIKKIVRSHIQNGKYYDRSLRNIPGVELCRYYEGSEPSYWVYTLKVERRDDFIRYLAEHNVVASPLHARNDKHTVFRESATPLPNLDKFYERMVHIPCGWWVSTEDREFIASLIGKGW